MKIGTLEVHPPQIKAGKEIWDNHFSRRFEDKEVGDNNVLLVAEPQQGKTGTIVYVMHEMLKFLKRVGATWDDFQIIYLTSISDTELQNQTVGRIQDAFSEFVLAGSLGYNNITKEKKAGSNATSKVKVHPTAIVVEHIGGKGKRQKLVGQGRLENADNVSRLVKTSGIKYRLVIFDECHMALARDGVNHSVLDLFGLDNLAELNDKGEWQLNPSNTCFLHVSATPFPHITSTNVYSIVNIKVDDKYYGIPEMLESGAIQGYSSTGDLVKKLRKSYIESENLGGCVIRVSPSKKDKTKSRIIDELLNLEGCKYDDYDSSGSASSISELDEQILLSYGINPRTKTKSDDSVKVDKSVMFIKNALRVGKTLPAPVSVWVETSVNSNDDTLLQSIGRICSRDPEFKKTKVLVPSSVLPELERSARYYLDVRNGDVHTAFSNNPQSSRYNRVKKTHLNNVPSVEVEIPDGVTDIREYVLNREDAKTYFENITDVSKWSINKAEKGDKEYINFVKALSEGLAYSRQLDRYGFLISKEQIDKVRSKGFVDIADFLEENYKVPTVILPMKKLAIEGELVKSTILTKVIDWSGFEALDFPDRSKSTKELLYENIDKPTVREFINFIESEDSPTAQFSTKYRMSGNENDGTRYISSNIKAYQSLADKQEDFRLDNAETNTLYVNESYINYMLRDGYLSSSQYENLRKYFGKVLVFKHRYKSEDELKSSSELVEDTLLKGA